MRLNMRSTFGSQITVGVAGAMLLSLLTLTGCASVKNSMGWQPVLLDKISVASIKASLPKGPGMSPGEKFPLLVVLTEPDGKILETSGAGPGKVPWKDLEITASVVTVDQKGVVFLPDDPRISDGKNPHVTITVPSHPDLRAELDIPVRYDHAYTSDFSGTRGLSGSSGMDGLSGASGSHGLNRSEQSIRWRKRFGWRQWLGWRGRRTRRRRAAGADPSSLPIGK
jgi:hypothetical protein